MLPATSSPVQLKADAPTSTQRKADAATPTPIGPRPSTVALFAGVQRKATSADDNIEQNHASVLRGVATAAEPLPHTERIQPLFGRHDGGGVQTPVGGDVARASGEIEERSTIEDLFGGMERRASVEPAPVQRTSRGVPFLQLGAGPIQQRASDEAAGGETAEIHEAAQRGISTPATQLPHLDQIQSAFGRHDISAVRAHVGPDAAASARAMGASAYATGDHVVLGAPTDLFTVAHEAAHVVQQRGGVQLAGGVGAHGDAYERHADAVAERVVTGRSAEDLLAPLAVPGPGAAGPPTAVQRLVAIGEGAALGVPEDFSKWSDLDETRQRDLRDDFHNNTELLFRFRDDDHLLGYLKGTTVDPPTIEHLNELGSSKGLQAGEGSPQGPPQPVVAAPGAGEKTPRVRGGDIGTSAPGEPRAPALRGFGSDAGAPGPSTGPGIGAADENLMTASPATDTAGEKALRKSAPTWAIHEGRASRSEDSGDDVKGKGKEKSKRDQPTKKAEDVRLPDVPSNDSWNWVEPLKPDDRGKDKKKPRSSTPSQPDWREKEDPAAQGLRSANDVRPSDVTVELEPELGTGEAITRATFTMTIDGHGKRTLTLEDLETRVESAHENYEIKSSVEHANTATLLEQAHLAAVEELCQELERRQGARRRQEVDRDQRSAWWGLVGGGAAIVAGLGGLAMQTGLSIFSVAQQEPSDITGMIQAHNDTTSQVNLSQGSTASASDYGTMITPAGATFLAGVCLAGPALRQLLNGYLGHTEGNRHVTDDLDRHAISWREQKASLTQRYKSLRLKRVKRHRESAQLRGFDLGMAATDNREPGASQATGWLDRLGGLRHRGPRSSRGSGSPPTSDVELGEFAPPGGSGDEGSSGDQNQ
jgi:hypothetical protein